MSNQEPPTTIADIVRARRTEMGITQNDLAELLDMSQEWLSALEQGRIKSPRMTTLRAMASKMSIDLEDLVIAAQLATSKSGARKIIESQPASEPLESAEINWDNPVMRLVMDHASKMSPENLKRIAAVMEAMRNDDGD